MRGHEAPSARARPLALAFAGFLSLAVAMGIGRFVYTPILPDMVDALGLTKSHAGLIASSNFAGYLTGALIAALKLRGSRAAWTLGALLASAVTTLAMGLVDTLPGFLAMRFAGGVASAFVLVFSSAMVLEGVRVAGRPGLAALHFAGVGIGIAASALVVAIVARSGGGWQAEWLATGAVALAASIAVAALLPPTVETPPAGGMAAAKRSAAPLVLAYGLFGFGYVITATFLVAIMREEPGLAPYEPWVWMLVGLSGAPSVFVWDRIAMRIGAATTFGLACLVEAVGVAASAVLVSAAGAAFTAVLLGATFMAITALGLRVARDLGPSDPRRMVAVMTVAFSIGQIVGPLYAGALHDRLGSFVPASLTAAAALVLAALLPLRLTHPAQRA